MESKIVTVKSDMELLKLLDETPIGIELKESIDKRHLHIINAGLSSFETTVVLSWMDGDIFSCFLKYPNREACEKMMQTYKLLNASENNDSLTIQINYI